MNKPRDPREEQRLAAKLRENLKRRKQQARARATLEPQPEDNQDTAPAPLKPDAGSDS